MPPSRTPRALHEDGPTRRKFLARLQGEIFLNFLISKLPAPDDEDLSKGILDAIDMDSYRVEKRAVQKILLPDEDAEIDDWPGAQFFPRVAFGTSRRSVTLIRKKPPRGVPRLLQRRDLAVELPLVDGFQNPADLRPR